MIVFLNGKLVPEEQAVVSVFDRGLLYGDGLFEAVRVFNGKPFRWDQHLERLQRGADFLRIRIRQPLEALRGFADQVVARNQMPDSLLRIVFTRGVGPRGYSPKGADRPTMVMSLHPAPARPQEVFGWRLVTSTVRLPANEPLANFKTCNKLAQVLARAEADAAGANEALLLNTEGSVVEGSSSNLFWIEQGTVYTPPLAAGILPGVTRAVVMDLCRTAGLTLLEGKTTPERLRASEGLFLSLTSAGIAEAITLDGRTLARSAAVTRLHAAYWDLLVAECC
jgi:branched-chain amino acid aminotransferase